jgi:hypothetical protein
MGTLRFLGLAAFMFAAAFLGMNRFLRGEPLEPHSHVTSQFQQSSVGDDEATRDRLRTELLNDAQSLAADLCNDTLKKHYIEAANNYARAWLSIVPCIRSQTCTQSDSKRLDLAAKAFGTPMDDRVREAMRTLHDKHIFKLGDFPNDTAFFVAELASDGTINPRAQRFAEIEAKFDDDPEPSQQACGR